MERTIQVLELVRPMVKASPFFGNTFEGCVETTLEICKIVQVRVLPARMPCGGMLKLTYRE
jgi:hypothetical protein